MDAGKVNLAPVSELIGAARHAGNEAARRAELDKNAFLQLLVAQIRHQDPLNPADSTQFLAQLAQFSELEQMINISTQLEAIRAEIAALKTQANGPSTVSASQTEP